MIGISKQSLMHSKGVFGRRPGFSVSSAFAASILVLLALVGWPQRAIALSSIPNENTWIANNAVNAIADNGTTIIIGGDFTYVGPHTGHGVPLNATSGSPETPYPKVDGTVYAVIPDGSGGWYIGGAFTQVGTLNRNYIAHIRPDGTVDPVWNPSADDTVRALALSGTKLYVGGDFTSIVGTARNHLAALDGSGALTPWDPNAGFDGDPAGATVNALLVSGTTVYAGGTFTSIGAQSSQPTRNNIAAIDATGDGNATSWNPNANNTVKALVLSGTTVYAGGDFTSIGSNTRNRLAAIDATSDGTPTSWNPDPDGAVNAMVLNGTKLYVGGSFLNFNFAGGTPVSKKRLARFTTTTGALDSFQRNTNDTVIALAVTGTNLYLGGEFTTVGSLPYKYIASIDLSTNDTRTWNPNPEAPVFALAGSGTTIYAGGSFISVGGEERLRLAALNASGTLTSWNPKANGSVDALAVRGTTVYAGGAFTKIGAQSTQPTRNRIAALNAMDTGNATSWDPNANERVFALAVDGTTVYAGGRFTIIGGTTRNRIAALNDTGNATSWDPGNLDTDGPVKALAVSLDGKTVYAGGEFFNIGAQTPFPERSYLAALDADSGNATPWNPVPDSSVYALVLKGSTLYVGGEFGYFGDQFQWQRSYIGALDVDTGNATAWDPSADASVTALAVSGQQVYAGGYFNSFSFDGVITERPYLASLEIGSGEATSWAPNADNAVFAIVARQNTLYVGGDFLSMGGEVRPHFAQFPSGVTVSGRVSSGGAAVPGITINLTGAATKSTTTDFNGNYRFSGLSDGAYAITPSDIAYTFAPLNINVTISGADLTGKNFTATQIGYTVSGTVTSGQSGLSGVTVNLTGAATKSTTTDSNGTYRFGGLSNGGYTVTPSKAGYTFTPNFYGFNVSGANVTKNFTADLIAYSISGTLTSGGSALSGVTVNLTGAATQSATTDGNGNYSFSGLLNGAYTITPSKTGYTFTPPSINVNVNGADVTGQNFAAPLGKATLVSPSGTISGNTPAYTWNAVPSSTYYYLYVNDSTGNKVSTWYSKEAAGCSGDTGTCTASPGTALAAGAGTWWVQTWNTNGYGPWSAGLAFTVPPPPLPGKATLVSPSGAISTSTPAYTWNADPLSTWYLLYVNDSTGNKISTWYSKEQAGCSGGTGTCTASPGTVLAPGSGIWWVQTYGSNGYGPWSDSMSFSVPPGKATLLSPSGTSTTTSTPDYTWKAVPGSTYYYLYVNDSTGNKITRWYSKEQAGCSGGTETETCTASPGTILAPGSGIWWVQTYGSNGYGPWSDGMSFTVPPGKAALISPKETISGNTPPFSWHAVPGSTSYYLYVNDSTGNKISKWYSKEQAGCSGGAETEICTASPGTVLAPGSGIWWVQTWAENGYGPWSDGLAFVVSSASGLND